VTALLDILLLFATVFSVYLTVAWGEMAGFPVGGDRSRLSGLGGVPIFMMMRWTLLAFVLAGAANRGGFPSLPGGKGVQMALVVGVHMVLGYVSFETFDWVVRGIQSGDAGPQRYAWLFGLVLPLAVLLTAFWGINRGWLPRHPWIGAILVAGLLWSQLAAWRQGYRRPEPVPPAVAD